MCLTREMRTNLRKTSEHLRQAIEAYSEAFEQVECNNILTCDDDVIGTLGAIAELRSRVNRQITRLTEKTGRLN